MSPFRAELAVHALASWCRFAAHSAATKIKERLWTMERW
jgi:hypothetical protein